MKYYFTFWFILLITCKTQAQRFALDTNYRRPYLVVNGVRADPLSLMVLDSKDIKQIVTLTQTQASKYGAEGTAFGAVEVTLKDGAELLTWKEILKYYHFKASAVSQPVAVQFGLQYDHLIVEQPKLLIASKSSVASISTGWHLGVPNRLVLHKKMPISIANPDGSVTIGFTYKDPDPQLEELQQIFKSEAKRKVKY